MYKLKYTGTRLLAAIALALPLFTACSVDDSEGGASVDNNGTAYLSIAINVSGATDEGSRAVSRAYSTDEETKGPSGGETGDGTRKGENWENKINNVTMLIYKSEKDDLSDDDATIVEAFYFDANIVGNDSTNHVANKDNTNRTYRLLTTKIPYSYLSEDYHIYLIANAGNLTTAWKGKTIGQLKTATFSWNQIVTPVEGAHDAFHKTEGNKSTEGGYENFLMTSYEDCDFKSDVKYKDGSTVLDGSKEKPYLIETGVMRLAARIDIVPNPQNVSEYESETDYPFVSPKASVGYCYDIMDGSKCIGGFSLEYVVPYNALNADSYCVLRGQTGASAESNYFTTNITSPSYIVTPYTATQSALADNQWRFKGTPATSWLNHADKEKMYIDFYKIRDGEGSDTDDKQTINGKSDIPLSYKFFTLDYVQENTSFDNNTDYATGLVFKGKIYTKAQWDAEKHEPKTDQKDNGEDKVYTYVIRHNDPNGSFDTSCPMLYGIVRNNIYRVRIKGINGKDDGIECSINVRKWAQYTHDEVNL